MKLTFPHMGNTYIVVKALYDDLGIDYIIPPYNNKESLEIGTKYAPELACLPFKINLGNYIHAYKQGADTIMITGGCGPCRFGYYCELQREVLSDIGYEMDIITIEAPNGDVKELLKRIRKLCGGFNLYKILKTIKNTTQIAKQVDDLEKLVFRVMPREIKKGTTSKVYKAFLERAKFVKGSKGIKNLIKETTDKLNAIEIDKDFIPLKVGIVGEIYSTIDPFTNLNIQTKLGEMGIETDRAVSVSNWIIEHMIKNALKLPRDLRFKKVAKPYLGAMIGGHAQETVGNTILYAQDGYDGVIQIYPFSCMPEIVAESILPSVEKDFGIPVLTLIIDELTGEAGYLTRIEAFTDMLKRKKQEDLAS